MFYSFNASSASVVGKWRRGARSRSTGTFVGDSRSRQCFIAFGLDQWGLPRFEFGVTELQDRFRTERGRTDEEIAWLGINNAVLDA